MAARRSLSWVGFAAIALPIVVVLLIARGRGRHETVAEVEPAIARTIGVIVIADSAKGTWPAHITDSLTMRMHGAPGIRVVRAVITPMVDVGQIRELLNASYLLEVRAGARDTVVVAYRQGDSTLLRRSYRVSADESIETAILADAARLTDPNIAARRSANAPTPAAEARARIARADSLMRRGNVGEALREARRAHELDPLSAEIHLAYARLLDRSGRDSDAARERQEQQRIATILKPTPKDTLARSRFKHVPKRPPRSSRRARAPGRD